MSWPNNIAGIKTIVILLSFVFLFVVAVLLDLQYLYMMAVTLAVLPLASYGLALLGATRFTARREHAQTATEGRVLTVTLDLEARGGLPQGAVRVADHVPDMMLPEPGTVDGSALYDWNGQSGSRTYHVVPQKRGVYRFGPVTIQTTDPLGLFSFAAPLALETEVVVHPSPLPSSVASIGGEGHFGRRERDGKSHRGDGTDFHGVREYRTGDSLRRVHWPTTARTGELAVIEFERAYQQDVVVVLDRRAGTNHGTGRKTTLEYAIKVAATLVERSILAGGGVTFITQGLRIRLRVGSGEDAGAVRFRIMDALARIESDAITSLVGDLNAAQLIDGAYVALITSNGDRNVSTLLGERIRRGDTIRVYFVEPTSFGGPTSESPAVAGGELRLITQADDPWQEGGHQLEHILRDSD